MSALERLVSRRSQALPRLIRRLGEQDNLFHQRLQAAAGPRIRIRGRWVLSFAATNYLGLSRDPRVLRAAEYASHVWGTSLGMPRALATPCLTAHLEAELARLTGQESALVFPSTTHIALDVIPLLAGPKGAIFIDEWAYPISLEGAYAAARRGARVRRFPHNDYRSLANALEAHNNTRDKVIVCDGVYPSSGNPAPLRMFAQMARAFDAVVYVDDAHGVGVLGRGRTRDMPYGRGGGGTPRYFNVAPGNIVHVGSLSKAFGVPVAFVAGPTGFTHYLRTTTPTYVHSSPPAIPMLAAALAALQVHSVDGEPLRRGLAGRVRRFQHGLARADLNRPNRRLFPIQTLRFGTPQAAWAAARQLRQKGIWGVLQLQPPDQPKGGAVRFVLTSRHENADIDEAVRAISHLFIAP